MLAGRYLNHWLKYTLYLTLLQAHRPSTEQHTADLSSFGWNEVKVEVEGCGEGKMLDGCDEDDWGGGLTGDSIGMLGFTGGGDFSCSDGAGSVWLDAVSFCTRFGRSAHKPIKTKYTMSQ